MLHDPGALVGQRRRIGRDPVRVQAHVHAEARKLRLEDDRRAARPVARFAQCEHARARGGAGAARGRKPKAFPFAVQRAQLVEVVREHTAAGRQQMPVARQVEHFLAVGDDEVDPVPRDCPRQSRDESGRIVARRCERGDRADGPRPARRAARHAVGHVHVPALACEAARMVGGDRRAASQYEHIRHRAHRQGEGRNTARVRGERYGACGGGGGPAVDERASIANGGAQKCVHCHGRAAPNVARIISQLSYILFNISRRRRPAPETVRMGHVPCFCATKPTRS